MAQHLARFTGRGRHPVRRQGAGEDGGVPDRAAPEPADGPAVSLAGALDGDGEPLLLLWRRPGLRALLPEVLRVLPLQGQALSQRARVRQAPARPAGIAYEALDNGILSCAEPRQLQALCDGLSAAKIEALLRKWLAACRTRLRPGIGGRATGMSSRSCRAEFSLTQVLDRPVTGRMFFEEVIRENLDLGRPDQVQLIFDRRVSRRTPGRFRTRVITEGVMPSLHVDYKHTRIKQYHKEGPGAADGDDDQRRVRLRDRPAAV